MEQNAAGESRNKEPDKYRHELKYLCSEQQMRLLEMRIRHVCEPDPHAGADGRYTVRSVYFDDYQDSCYFENEDGVDRREKFRIRLYDGSRDGLILECKRKLNGKNHKSSCGISEQQCRDILRGSFALRGDQDPALNRFYLLYRTRFYRPKVVVEYERTPYLYPLGNVRITFDRNISATARVQDFLDPRIHARPTMQRDMHLLEVKYDELIPDYIYRLLQTEDLLRTAHSKYYTARRLTRMQPFCGI